MPEELALIQDDEIVVLNKSHKYERRTVTESGPGFRSDETFAVKFLYKPLGIIGGKEVGVEAKQIMLKKYLEQWETEMSDSRREALRERIESTGDAIEELYNGNEESDGLYTLMEKAVEHAILLADENIQVALYKVQQQDLDSALGEALGDMLRDGYWSNTNYAPGQENSLYLDALDIMEEISKPNVSYTVSIQNLSMVSGYEEEQFKLYMTLRIWDEALGLNDYAFVSKLAEHIDNPVKTSVTISNEAIQIGASTLESILRRISMVAEAVNRKNALYDRAQAISPDGSIPMMRLKGTMDVLKTRLTSSVSNWYTDDNGNIVLESLDGKSAMKLCGEGFMIAAGRDEHGHWDWRTFGTGEGFTADAIITGFLSADRIEANTITANKLASDVGHSLDLSSNTSITLVVENTVTNIVEDIINDTFDNIVGYRLEVTTNNGTTLTDEIKETTLTAKLWRGSEDVTDKFDPLRFDWKRSSKQPSADAVWNAAHQGLKSITIKKADIPPYSATFQCNVMS
jgi:hypothetical protein